MPSLTRLLGFCAALTVAAPLGCGSSELPRRAAQEREGEQCPVDAVRQFHCDDLLPTPKAGQGAPSPYELCPAGIQIPQTGGYPARRSVATLDSPYTAWARRRAPPGHSCCYSWCADLPPSDVDDVAANAGCNEPSVIRESYCMPELESGASSPASAPYDRCPVVIQPPMGQFFTMPKAVPFDPDATARKRGQGEELCCYAWCSRMPAGVMR